jgi:hypothetical protein
VLYSLDCLKKYRRQFESFRSNVEGIKNRKDMEDKKKKQMDFG